MNEEFLDLLESNLRHAEAFRDRFEDVQESQEPIVVTVSCSDSRVLQDDMWMNRDPGQIFTCGNIGNRVVQQCGGENAVSGDVLYPIAHTGTRTAVIVGHTGCGAVTATYRDIVEGLDEPAGIQHCIDLLRSVLEDGVEQLPNDVDESGAIDRLVEYNVDQQVNFLLGSDEVPDDVDVIGAVYDFQGVYSGDRGEVHVINVNGENDAETLREQYPEMADRVERVWNL